METHDILFGLLGGGVIGIAAGALLVLNGRIAGISGILGGMLAPSRGEVGWRMAVLLGLLAGGVGLALVYPPAYPTSIDTSTTGLVIAGLLVGFGTRLGSGCTSGHGVCGLARFSPRSLIATISFIATGAVTVWVIARVFGG